MGSGPKGASVQERLDRQTEAKKALLERFKKLTNLEGANLTIGEDVAQHDMVACASHGWQSKFDMPMDRIAAHCVTEKGWMVAQFVDHVIRAEAILGRLECRDNPQPVYQSSVAIILEPYDSVV